MKDNLKFGRAGEHLVCYDLIMMGYDAFLSDQGLPFDVICIKDNKLIKIQVKSTKSVIEDFRKRLIYRFGIRRGKGNLRRYTSEEVDVVAFVALDTKEIAYISIDKVKQTMEFKSHNVEYFIDKGGAYINDFRDF